ncbi:tRNA (N6-isopentenyl adenosine(37)-C2)-methylthiotransferase MiaB [Daejeonella lutea]|uniref:tRNA-2-methylthio-N(6)-dimethylallyladenosine synthase n=1 Tax=Daejeonella lutea TaxID=572036 RepID=A0A1T5DY58_9SPHI|nr:tRNA (N6-isopentenyl adenosine(37)-C2)-methylthiotransferase MiaB [Daejeonella lutea]SKB76526.1 tRNA-2-methylthio-N6-dimethylallyladenosine synthase [Daejeonella lutea]
MFDRPVEVIDALHPTLHDESRQGEALVIERTAKYKGRKLYIESYGCAMNFADSEIVASIMLDMGFETTSQYKEADVIFINTCSIRDNAEQRVRNRLREFSAAKRKSPGMTIGVLGCMAERLKSKFLEEEKLVDIVIGPDSYRDLPNLINQSDEGNRAVNVLLSREETYADISPVRLNSNGISAFVSIMRGCDNMCSFCVVPFTRGRERSRDPFSIVEEARELFNNGYKEVTLLGQNVDSYKWSPVNKELELENGTNSVGKPINGKSQQLTNFAQLLEMVALIDPELRVRFSTSHPKDITDEVLHTMVKYDNICNHIHLPVQSGNSRVLDMMNRTYTREWYLERVNTIRRIIPDCAISTDVIIGFCTETEDEHQDTLSMMDYVQFDFAYMYTYSERPGTLAAKRFEDDIPQEVKTRRFNEVLAKQQEGSHKRLLNHLGKTYRVLIDGLSKKSDLDFSGKTEYNITVIFPVTGDHKPGDYVNVLIDRCTPATLLGNIVTI